MTKTICWGIHDGILWTHNFILNNFFPPHSINQLTIVVSIVSRLKNRSEPVGRHPEGGPGLGARCEASCDSCLRGAQCLNLWVPREQPSSSTTKTPAALLLCLTLTHKYGCVTEGAPSPRRTHTDTHKYRGPPSTFPASPWRHHGNTVLSWISGDLCVCVCV